MQKENFDPYEGVMREKTASTQKFQFWHWIFEFWPRVFEASEMHTSQIPLPGWLKIMGQISKILCQNWNFVVFVGRAHCGREISFWDISVICGNFGENFWGRTVLVILSKFSSYYVQKFGQNSTQQRIKSSWFKLAGLHCGRFETSLSFVEIFLNELEKLDMCSKYTPFEASAVGLRGEALSLLDQWVTGQDIFVHTNLLLNSSIFGLLLRRGFEFFLHKNSIGVERASRAF